MQASADSLSLHISRVRQTVQLSMSVSVTMNQTTQLSAANLSASAMKAGDLSAMKAGDLSASAMKTSDLSTMKAGDLSASAVKAGILSAYAKRAGNISASTIKASSLSASATKAEDLFSSDVKAGILSTSAKAGDSSMVNEGPYSPNLLPDPAVVGVDLHLSYTRGWMTMARPTQWPLANLPCNLGSRAR